MSNKKIKGLTVEIGGDTTKLGEAMDAANKKSRALSSELGSINKLLKFDPSNTTLLAQKQQVLTDAVANTSDELEMLREAERQVQEQFEKGEASAEQVRALQREIISTENKLSRYEQAVRETSDAIEQLGKESQSAAAGVEDVAENEKKAERAGEDLADDLSGDLRSGFVAVTAAATAAAGAIVGLTESTREYRTEQGRLAVAYEDAGFSAETAYEAYSELQSILGESDQASEAASHLAELTESEQELAAWTGDILPGVFDKFGKSLPLENLTEAANETAKVGQVTGALADALNWAVQEGETFGVTLREDTEANQEWNEAVKNAASAEDYFNLALQKCSGEQERQSLITSTLTKLYAGAAKQYKATNQEVIRANKANEEWNATLASVAENTEPLITDIKLLGAELVGDMEEPIKRVSEYVRDTFLPALSEISGWTSNHLPEIKGGIVAVTAAMTAFKVASLSAEVAQTGLKTTIMATTVAQKALNLASAATPWGVVAIAATSVLTALAAYAVATKDAVEETDVLTESERELMEQATETAAALKEQRAATDEAAAGITAQMSHVGDLANELETLADSSGTVQEADRARAEFILGELNSALGTEYSMTDGVIQKYDELCGSIEDVIAAKTANALLEAHNADYLAAIEAESAALSNVVLAEKDYQAQLAASSAAEAAYQEYYAEFQILKSSAKAQADQDILLAESYKLEELRVAAAAEQTLLEEKKTAYDDAALAYGENAAEIMDYEDAQTAVLEGNYERATEILRGKSTAFSGYADDVDEATTQALAALEREAINAGLEAERTKKNFEDGIEGYTQDMVDEAEQGYEDALNAYDTAYNDAYGVGQDLGSGLSSGMESKRGSVVSKVRSIVSNIISAARQEADSHSPSRKMIDFGEDMTEGTEVGMGNRTKSLLAKARDQVNALMAEYSNVGSMSGQTVQRSLQERDSVLHTPLSLAMDSGSLAILVDILEAVRAGHVLMLNDETLVGALLNRLDAQLGLQQTLAERGVV